MLEAPERESKLGQTRPVTRLYNFLHAGTPLSENRSYRLNCASALSVRAAIEPVPAGLETPLRMRPGMHPRTPP